MKTDVLNQRAKIVYKNKSLADKFKHMEIDRQLEKEDQTSQDNIFPESKANMFTNFGQSDLITSFHEKRTWKEKIAINKLRPSLNGNEGHYISPIFDPVPSKYCADIGPRPDDVTATGEDFSISACLGEGPRSSPAGNGFF